MPIRCILCAEPLLHDIMDRDHGERTETLVCAAHSDQDLRDLGLNELWGGILPAYSSAFFTGGTSRLVGAWEQGEGGYGVYLLLEDGQLLLFVCWTPEVEMARVPPELRRLVEPQGVPPAHGPEWRRAIDGGWVLREAVREPGGDVILRFAAGRSVRFSTAHESWRELGDGRYFLTHTWQSDGAGNEP